MAEITYKRSGELLRGVFKILLDEPDGLPSREVLTRLEKEVVPTKYEKDSYPATPGRRRYETQVRFSTINCVKAGWLAKDRGRWVLTEVGKAAYASTTDPEQFFRESYICVGRLTCWILHIQMSNIHNQFVHAAQQNDRFTSWVFSGGFSSIASKYLHVHFCGAKLNQKHFRIASHIS